MVAIFAELSERRGMVQVSKTAKTRSYFCSTLYRFWSGEGLLCLAIHIIAAAGLAPTPFINNP